MRLVAIGCALLSWSVAAACWAQSYQSSPHVEGDGANVRVYYDQRVHHTHVKKELFVYKGPKTEDVLSAVQRIVDQRQGELERLIDKDDMQALRAELLEQLDQQFRAQPDVLAAIRRLAPVPSQQRGHWGLAAGLSGVVAGGAGLGGAAQLDGYLHIPQPGSFRHAVGIRAGFEVLKRSQHTPSPTAATLGETSRVSYHGWLEPGYELFWLKGHLALQLSLLLGAQVFEWGVGHDPYVTFGVGVAPELRLGPNDGTGVSIGLKYRASSMTVPVFPFDALETVAQPERALQHLLLLYAGMYFSIFGS